MGLPDTTVAPDAIVDVDGRDPARTPLPWEPPMSAGPGAGFTAGMPWLPITDEAERLNVHTQAGDPRSMLSLYRQLLVLRHGSRALRSGTYRSLDTGDAVYAYLREHRDQRFLVALNFTSAAVRIGPTGADLAGTGRLMLSTDPDHLAGGEVDLEELVVGPDEGVLVHLD